MNLELHDAHVEAHAQNIQEQYEFEDEYERNHSYDKYGYDAHVELIQIVADKPRISVTKHASAVGTLFLIDVKSKKGIVSELSSWAEDGGLDITFRKNVFHAHEFSLKKYENDDDTRAAAEYVKRKLKKLVK